MKSVAALSTGIWVAGSAQPSKASSSYTVTKLPTVVDTVAVGDVGWDDINNIKTDSPACGNAAVNDETLRHGEGTDILRGREFGFAIPGTATIDKIEVHFKPSGEVTTGSGAIIADSVQLWKQEDPLDDLSDMIRAGTEIEDWSDIIGGWPAVCGPIEVAPGTSGVGDLWGTTWTPAEINLPKFGASVVGTAPYSAKKFDLAIDWLKVKVYYTD